MQFLVELLMGALYAIQIRKDNNELYKCKSQHWMETEIDNVLDYWNLSNGKDFGKMNKTVGLDGSNDSQNTLPSHLGAIFSSNSKRNLINFLREITSFYNNSIINGDMDSMYIEKTIGTCWTKPA